MTENYKDWPQKLHFAIWGYWTSIRTSKWDTPFSLVYGMEVVQPVEFELSSLRIVLKSKIPEVEGAKTRFDELTLLDEQWLQAVHHVQVYQCQIAKHFNKTVKAHNIKEGDLVLKALCKTVMESRGKFHPN